MITSIRNAFSVKGLKVLITGGTQGLGKAMADAFCEDGAQVSFIGRNEKKGAEVENEIKAKYPGCKIKYYQGDLVKPGDPQRLIDLIAAEMGGINVLINNAGCTRFFDSMEAVENDFKDWQDVIDLDLTGYFKMASLAARYMKKQGWGSIINITSNAADIVNLPQRMVSYSSAKAGANRMTKMLAHEWAPFKIRVNAIAPGYTDSDLTPVEGEEFEKLKAFWTEHTPSGRWGKPIEVAAMAVYLASEASEQVTGAIFTIDGGYSLAN